MAVAELTNERKNDEKFIRLTHMKTHSQGGQTLVIFFFTFMFFFYQLPMAKKSYF